MYFAGLWSMWLAPAVLEGRWLIGSLRRSSELVDGHWFHVTGTLALAAVIVSVLQYAPTLLVELPLTVSAATRGQTGLGAPELVISTAAGLVVRILIASLSSIVYTVLFVDLRNRREGTDIAGRLSQLEGLGPIPAHG
jgi:hypothetical protein